VFQGRLLSDKGVLAVTFCASRENAEVRHLLLSPYILSFILVYDAKQFIGEYLEEELPHISIQEHRRLKTLFELHAEIELERIYSKLKDRVVRDGIDANILDLATDLYYYKSRLTTLHILAITELRKRGESKRYKKLVESIHEIDEQLHTAMKRLAHSDFAYFPMKIERYSYRSAVPMKTSFYQFGMASKVLAGKKWYVGALHTYDILPPVKVIPQPKRFISKREVIEAIKQKKAKKVS